MPDPLEFDPLGPLPRGVTVLEASAGTGKTHTIATLAVRHVAAGLPISSLLLITFGNAASKELSSRVHARFDAVARSLAAFLADGRPPGDELAAHLAAWDAPTALSRLEAALSSFDEATIATTHTFCRRMADRLGELSALDGSERLLEAPQELVDEVCQDVYLSVHAHADRVFFGFGEALAIGRAASERACEIEPPSRDVDEPRAEFAELVRAEVVARRRRAGAITYDDMIDSLVTTLTDPDTGERAARQLAAAFPVVLVDEFQDTDPRQWRVLREAFVGRGDLCLIGDPKQSIYAFRDADVDAYLDAVARAETHGTLSTNHRSDEPLARAVVELFDGASMGHESIKTRRLDCVRPRSRLRAETDMAPFRVRRIDASAPLRPEQAARLVDDDLVRVLAELLSGRTTLERETGRTALRPSDVAVLCRGHRRARQVRDRLAEAGWSVVYPGEAGVFASSAAESWSTLLAAVASPRKQHLITAYATSDFVGRGVDELIRDQDRALITEAAAQVAALAGSHASGGVLAMWERARELTGLDARLAARLGGERTLADLAHIAEELTRRESASGAGPDALRAWLLERRSRGDTETSRRLDTDADAVLVTTAHGSKGLEFPVVLLPTATQAPPPPDARAPFVRRGPDGRRLNVGARGARERRIALDAHREDVAADELRLFYVACTRAQSGVVAWWTPTESTRSSPLHRLVCRAGGAQPPPEAPLEAISRARSGPLIAFEPVGPGSPDPRPPDPGPAPTLVVRSFERVVDGEWARKSYSGWTSDAHDGDEADLSQSEAMAPLAGAEQISPMADLPAGAAFGTLVHEILERRHDSSDLRADVEAVAAANGASLDVDQLTVALAAVLATPLGPIADGRALSELTERANELSFDAPLLGRASLARFAETMAAHLGADDPLADYPRRLASSQVSKGRMLGFLTGSIDSVLAVGEGDGRRYLVVDYKTNRFPTQAGEPLRVGHYSQPAMAEAMMRAHYPLQAALYAVALHRHLAWRLPGYQPELHLGGAAYLFVRGMAGPETPTTPHGPCGVFAWRPPAAMVVELSETMAGLR